MNKYQEALNVVKGCIDIRCDEEIAIVQELVDKETPMKINIGKKDYSSLSKGVYDICCPCCEELLGFTNQNIIIPYCPFCGQKLDWSDEDMEVENNAKENN